jgi:ketoreductase RED2
VNGHTLAAVAELTDRVALVTGSSSGIGEAVARRLAADGMRVVVNSSTSVEAGERVAASLGDGCGHYEQADIADPEQAARLVERAAARWGRLDVLVNNAGYTVRIPHEDLDACTPEVWRRILDVNLVGTWSVTRAAVPHLRNGGAGVIVNVGSLAGERPTGSSIPYAVSKAGLHHMTRLLAAALGPDIRVNAVAPGLIETPWTESWEDLHGLVKVMAPLRRSGTPDDVAEVVAVLVRGEYVTGTVVVVDGGLALR